MGEVVQEKPDSVESTSDSDENGPDTPKRGGEEPTGGSGTGAQEQTTGRVAFNLFLLALCGVLVSAWLIWFTQVFPIFNSLVALSGIFAWLASLGYALSEERKKALQELAESKFLARTWRVPVCVFVVLLLLLAVNLCGSTIVLDSYRDESFRAFLIEPVCSPSWWRTRSGTLEPHTQHKRFLWHFLVSRDFRVDATGLPEIRVTLPVLLWHHLHLPRDAFATPRVLVRPSYDLFGKLHQGAKKYQLVLIHEGDEKVVRQDYRGQAVWLGVPESWMPAVPARVERRWRAELSQIGSGAPADPPWVPSEISDAPVSLQVGDRIELKVRVAGSREMQDAPRSNEVQVLPIDQPDDFPQEVVLNAPGTDAASES